MELTRRQILGAFLASPVAAAACKRPAPPPIAGSLLGASMDVGHRIRGGPLPTPSETKRVAVAIVGGGPSGLSAAWRLERLGITDYELYDLEPRAGGTSTFGTNGIVPYPWGAHYVPLPSAENRALTALLDEMGALAGRDERGQPIGAEEQLVRAPEERVYHLGRWYDGLYLRAGASEEDLRQLRAFETEVQRLVALRDARGRKAFTIPVAHSSDDAELLALDRITMAEWMRTHAFTSTRLLWLVDYACRDDYGLLAKDTSAWAGLFYFASRTFEEGDTAAELLSWPNGNGRIVEHLSRVAGPRISTGALVLDVWPKENEVELLVLHPAENRVRRIVASQAILAIPKMATRHVLRPWRESPPAFLAEMDYGAWMVANVFLRDRPKSRGFPLAWDNVLYDSPSLGYVVATHQALVDHGPTVFTYYYPFTEAVGAEGRKRLLSLDHAGFCDVIMGDLARAHDPSFRSLVERIDVWRWGHAMARPRVGSMSATSRAARAASLGRVHFAHSDVSGMGLFEEAQHWGVKAAELAATLHGVTGKESLT